MLRLSRFLANKESGKIFEKFTQRIKENAPSNRPYLANLKVHEQIKSMKELKELYEEEFSVCYRPWKNIIGRPGNSGFVAEIRLFPWRSRDMFRSPGLVDFQADTGL